MFEAGGLDVLPETAHVGGYRVFRPGDGCAPAGQLVAEQISEHERTSAGGNDGVEAGQFRPGTLDDGQDFPQPGGHLLDVCVQNS